MVIIEFIGVSMDNIKNKLNFKTSLMVLAILAITREL